MAALFELLTGYLDAVVSPKTRDRLAQNLLSFALQKPYLAVSVA